MVSEGVIVFRCGNGDVEVVRDVDVVTAGFSIPADRQADVIVQGAVGIGSRGELPVAEAEDEGRFIGRQVSRLQKKTELLRMADDVECSVLCPNFVSS